MFLATTAVEEFWDTSDDLLFLGEWCKLYSRRSAWATLPHRTFPYPWRDAKPFREIDAYCTKIYETVLPTLGRALNKTHGIAWTIEQYRVLIGPWLMYFIQQAYDKFTILKLALAANPDARTWLLSRGQYYTPLDHSEYLGLVSNDAFQLQLYSIILRAMGHDFPERDLSAPITARSHWELFGEPKDSLYRLGIRALSALAHATGRREIAVVTHPYFPHKTRWASIAKLAFRSKLRVLPDDYRYHLKISSKIDPSMRAALETFSDGDEFSRVLSRAIPESISVGYVEGFDDFMRCCESIPNRNVTTYYSANGLHASTMFCFHMANRRAKGTGTRLLYHQHGGGYGTDAFSFPEEHERACSDSYFTWGWQGELARYMPHPKIPGPSESRNDTTGVLLVMTTNPRYMQMFHCHVVSAQTLDYVARTAAFCLALPKGIPLILRSYPGEKGWHIPEHLSDKGVVFTSDHTAGPLMASVALSRISVFDHLATSYLEVLARNHPTVIFSPPEIYLVRQDARPYFDRLREAGILHDSAESAARHVAAVYDEPLAWWASPQVQNARSAFCERYARYDPDWVGAWVKELAP